MGALPSPTLAVWDYQQYVQGSTAGSAGEMCWQGSPPSWQPGKAGAKASTGATAGTPGTWTPAPPASIPPWDVNDPKMSSVVATPSTAWTTGQWVQGQAGPGAGDVYWNGTIWVAGKAP